MVLSSALPPITGKIQSRQFVAMKELLADNKSLHSQLEALPILHAAYAGVSRPCLREIDSPLTWVYCFLAYVAVLSPDSLTRNLLTYARLIIHEAQCHSGPGWLEYDKVFWQQAAVNPSLPWNEINSSLHAATILPYCSGPGRFCSLCHESDHLTSQCALTHLQPHPAVPSEAAVSHPQTRRAIQPETLEHICSSWNKGSSQGCAGFSTYVPHASPEATKPEIVRKSHQSHSTNQAPLRVGAMALAQHLLMKRRPEQEPSPC